MPDPGKHGEHVAELVRLRRIVAAVERLADREADDLVDMDGFPRSEALVSVRDLYSILAGNTGDDDA